MANGVDVARLLSLSPRPVTYGSGRMTRSAILKHQHHSRSYTLEWRHTCRNECLFILSYLDPEMITGAMGTQQISQRRMKVPIVGDGRRFVRRTMDNRMPVVVKEHAVILQPVHQLFKGHVLHVQLC